MNRKLLMTFALTFLGYLPFTASHAAFGSADQWISTKTQAIQAQGCTLDAKVIRLGLTAFVNAHKKGYDAKNVLTLIDYSKPSSQKRLWVFDLNTGKTLINTWVAHGKNSGDLKSTSFSNTNSSLKTSIGVFVTDSTYIGKHGLSLRIRGLDKGYNDNAYNRAVVVHAARYVSADMIKQKGQIGRSWGCPAVNPSVAPELIKTIKGQTVIFSYYPDQKYLSQSPYMVNT